MLKIFKKYTLIFAVTLNIISSGFFFCADTIRFSREDDSLALSTIGAWFAIISILPWAVFLALYCIIRFRKNH